MAYLLHTHTVMSYILALTAAGMFTHLRKVEQPIKGKRWLMLFYAGLTGWQLENVIRYSAPLQYYGTPAYSLQTVFMYIPFLALTLVAHNQYTYRYLVSCFKEERRVVLWISVALSITLLSFVAWNEYFNAGNLVALLLSCFGFGLFLTSWNIILCIRKAVHLRPVNPHASKAHARLALFNAFFVAASICSLVFGFFSTMGFWSYFLFVWFGTLASIVLYVTTSAVPANFEVKVTGFVFILAATVFSVITLAFYPPVLPDDMPNRLAQQRGLRNLMVIITIVVCIILLLLPYMLRISFTKRLHNLVSGVQSVNAGKLDTRIPVGLHDEIGELTQNFNQMTRVLNKAQSDLTSYAQTLEKKVAERTAQLERSFKELEETQAQLILREKMASLGELTAGIAHEIQNPLNFVNNFSDINVELFSELKTLLAGENLSPQNREAIEVLIENAIQNLKKINDHGKRADAIVKGMMQHSRNNSGDKQSTDINLLAEEYLKLSYHGMRAKDQTFIAYLQTHFDESIERLEIAPQEIGRVFLNLFNNSFYSITKKRMLVKGAYEPTVFVATKRLPQGVEIKVRDNGLGINPKILNKIYQPFYTTKPTGEGIGLGLSLAYDIITKGHAGQMRVDTEEGKYAEFTITIPFKGEKGAYANEALLQGAEVFT